MMQSELCFDCCWIYFEFELTSRHCVCRATDTKGAKYKLGIKLFGFQIKDERAQDLSFDMDLKMRAGCLWIGMIGNR